ncbi:hypothetical protein LINPERPRIM_LOCUS32461 [Linum perenne]
MRRSLFLRIVEGVTSHDAYFQCKPDCTGRQGLSTLQKCKTAIQMLAYDIQRLLHVGEQRGFPGMLGSIDCMHWAWKNCPTTWHGQYARGDHRTPTIMLEAVASQDLWIWHAFFGLPCTLNDINVLDRSPVFHEVLEGKAPKVQFSVNGRNYNLGYYLTDGIYPNWATFVKSIPLPQGPKHKLFAKKQ